MVDPLVFYIVGGGIFTGAAILSYYEFLSPKSKKEIKELDEDLFKVETVMQSLDKLGQKETKGEQLEERLDEKKDTAPGSGNYDGNVQKPYPK